MKIIVLASPDGSGILVEAGFMPRQDIANSRNLVSGID